MGREADRHAARRMHHADFTGADSPGNPAATITTDYGRREQLRLALVVVGHLATPRREDCGASINRVRRNS